MKQMIPFVKDISLDSKISEITSIALEHNLRMENNDSVVGTFTISGKYKMNDISINEEVFEKKINSGKTGRLQPEYNLAKKQKAAAIKAAALSLSTRSTSLEEGRAPLLTFPLQIPPAGFVVCGNRRTCRRFPQ